MIFIGFRLFIKDITSHPGISVDLLNQINNDHLETQIQSDIVAEDIDSDIHLSSLGTRNSFIKQMPDTVSYFQDRKEWDRILNDNREYIKVSYEGHFKTYDFEKDMDYLLTQISRLEGVINESSFVDKQRYISFVLSRDKFREFQKGIENYFPKEFRVESLIHINQLDKKALVESEIEKIENEIFESDGVNKKDIKFSQEELSELNKFKFSLSSKSNIINGNIIT